MKTVFLVGLEGTVSDHVMHKTSIQFLEGEKKRKKEKVLEGKKVFFLLVFGESRKGLLLALLSSSCP